MGLWKAIRQRRTERFDACWFIWVTNGGAAEITANSIASLQAQSRAERQKLLVGLLDDTAGEIISERVDTRDLEFLSIEQLPEWRELRIDLPITYDNYGTQNFNLRSASKYIFIQHLLREASLPVIFADGDVVYLKNPIAHIQSNKFLSEQAVLFQNDRPAGIHDPGLARQYPVGWRPKGSVVCTGFSVWRPRPEHLLLAERVKAGIHSHRDDQSSMQELNAWQKRHVQLLRQDLFPNGSLVFNPDGSKTGMFDRNEAYLVHANWVYGIDEKISRLKAGGYWLI